MSGSETKPAAAGAVTAVRKPTRLPGWAVVALVLSLALNLAVLGIAGGYWLRGPAPGASVSIQAPEGVRGMLRALTGPEREALRRGLRAHGGDLRAARQEIRAARNGLLNALRAEPFSEEALRKALLRQEMAWRGIGMKAADAMVELIATMPPERRAALAEELAAAQRRRPPAQDR